MRRAIRLSQFDSSAASFTRPNLFFIAKGSCTNNSDTSRLAHASRVIPAKAGTQPARVRALNKAKAVQGQSRNPR
jgi:hypothetical protein